MPSGLPVPPSSRDKAVPKDNLLETWKEIATYLNRDLRTVKRWETTRGLPVHRLPGGPKAAVYALKSELEAWRRGPGLHVEQAGRTEQASSRSHLLFWAVGAVFLLTLSGAVLWRFYRPRPAPAPRVSPLTSYPGVEWFPAFSPDGRQIAFSWNGDRETNYDIYVKLVRAGDPLPLTTDPAMDLLPAWSPDGRHIAFVRWHLGAPKFEYWVVPALGGAERRIAEGSITPNAFPMSAGIAWTPDGESLVTTFASSPEEPYRLVLISTGTGEIRRLTNPPADSPGDCCPVFSPDGHTLAFLRGTPGRVHKPVVLSLAGNYEPAGEARMLDIESCWNPMWSAGGRDLLCEVTREGARSLWRIPVRGTGAPRPFASIGKLGQHLAIAPEGNRIVYSDFSWEADVWEVGLSGAKPPVRLIASTGSDQLPQLSPDGTRIAFLSNRSGPLALWVCVRDGSKPLALTPVARPHGPSWSPTGQEIAFTCQVEQDTEDICLIAAGGGSPRRLTDDLARDILPSWSRDGKWVYFASNRSGTFQTWKTSPDQRGPAIQVTRNGGFGGVESADGKHLYFAKTPLSGEIWRLPVEGGEEEVALGDSIRSLRLPQNFAVGAGGMVFASSPDPMQSFELRFYSFSNRTTQLIARIDRALGNGMTLSPGGRWLLYTTMELRSGDLMMVEGFH